MTETHRAWRLEEAGGIRDRDERMLLGEADAGTASLLLESFCVLMRKRLHGR